MQRLLNTTLAAATLLIGGLASADDPTLVLHYKFDDGTGFIASDSSGSANHGAITDASWTADGRSNGALLFDGDGDYVRSDTYPFDPSTTDFSASVWFKPLHVVDYYWGIIAQRDNNGPGRFWLNTQQHGRLRTKIGNGDVVPRIEGSTRLQKDVWYHAVVTYTVSSAPACTGPCVVNCTGHNIQVYLNAVSEACGTDTAESTVGDMVIGAIKYMDRLYFNGIIDDVQIYRGALTPAQVTFLFQNPGSVVDQSQVSIDAFAADPASIVAGESSTLSWSTRLASAVNIAPGIGSESLTGSRQVTPALTTTYTLTAEGPGGPLTQQTTVTVAEPTLTSLVIDPVATAIAAGGSTPLRARGLDQDGQPLAATIAWSVDAGGAFSEPSSGTPVIEHTTTFASDGQPGRFTVTATAGALSQTATIRVLAPRPVLHLNCGSESIHVSGWEDEDPFRTNGEVYDFPATTVDRDGVANAAPAEVYLTCVNQPHSYDLPIEDGSYLVRLHFFDQYTALRAMDYWIEDIQVLDDFSVTDAAGGVGRAVTMDFEIQVSDHNGLQIEAQAEPGSGVFESGIEIFPIQSDAGTPDARSDSGADASLGEDTGGVPPITDASLDIAKDDRAAPDRAANADTQAADSNDDGGASADAGTAVIHGACNCSTRTTRGTAAQLMLLATLTLWRAVRTVTRRRRVDQRISR